MSYTLWSKGRLLGHTDLDYMKLQEKHRMGDFHPTELGERFMPIVTGAARALLSIARTSRHQFRDANGEPNGLSEGYEGNTLATAYADAAAAQAHLEGLELQLRRQDGTVVPTEWIDVRDTELLKSIMEAEGRSFEDEMEDEAFDLESIDPVLATDEERQLLEDVEHDMAIVDEIIERNAAEARAAGIDVPEEWEERTFPRYQIQIGLLDDSAVP